jgi:ankyrin repeat protein
MAKLLIEHGADTNARDSLGYTPLHWTAKYGHTETATFLLEHGADINARNNYGETPLSRAKESGYTKIASLLEEHSTRNCINRLSSLFKKWAR